MKIAPTLVSYVKDDGKWSKGGTVSAGDAQNQALRELSALLAVERAAKRLRDDGVSFPTMLRLNRALARLEKVSKPLTVL